MNMVNNIYCFSNFLDFYNRSISPKLCAIDIFVKTSEGIMDISEISKLLYISDSELINIMISKNISHVNADNFFDIMECGSSYICQMFFREKECGSPHIYTREQIAYIYDLDLDLINSICDKLNTIKVTSYSLPLIFAEIRLEDI